MRDGFVAVRGAVEDDAAAECRAEVARSLLVAGVDVDDPATWRPIVRVVCPEGEAFAAAGLAPTLAAKYDELIGPGRWGRRAGVGGGVVARFPSEAHPGEVGWHVDGNTWDGSESATDLTSRGRGLLAPFLFTDVGPTAHRRASLSAPTSRIPRSSPATDRPRPERPDRGAWIGGATDEERGARTELRPERATQHRRQRARRRAAVVGAVPHHRPRDRAGR